MKNRATLKKYYLNILDYFNILDLLHYKNNNKICVLMLHGVMASNENVSWEPLRPQISPSELKRVLSILSDHYQFITIEQAVDMLSGKVALIENALLITFDDGYRNNLDYALPICELFSIKPVLFVATGNIDSGLPFWVDRLDYALQQCMGELISLQFKGKIYQFDATSREALQQSYKEFRDKCKSEFSDDVEMNKLFNGLSKMLEIESNKALSDICERDDWSAVVSWEQLRKAVQEERLDIASHTVDHWRLDCLSQQELISQLEKSKKRIEQELSLQCDYFCYPNGNYNKFAINLLKKSGYRAAFSTDVGLCKLNDDLMRLKRFSFPVNKTKKEIIYFLNS